MQASLILLLSGNINRIVRERIKFELRVFSPIISLSSSYLLNAVEMEEVGGRSLMSHNIKVVSKCPKHILPVSCK